MNLYTKIKFGSTVLLTGLLFSLTANAATLELNLEKNIITPKEDVVVFLTVNSERQDINTAQATILFPVNLLEVTKIDRTDSIFTFWLQDPTYDNSKGTISFVGGSTSGFDGASLKLIKIYFRVKGSGRGRISITDAAITASDGSGSNVYNTAKGLEINIPATAEFQVVQLQRTAQEVTLSKNLPAVPTVNIPFYPDRTMWNNHSASFKATWNIGSDITNAGVALNKDPAFVPAASSDGLLGSKIFPALSDGIWYLHLRFRNNIGWGPTLHYRLAVDTTPPSSFKITTNTSFKTVDAMPVIKFASSDITSGIDSYTVFLDGVAATTTTQTNYNFLPILPGTHLVVVVALDKAGNSTSQSETFEILPITSPTITYVNQNLVVNEGSIIAGGTASNKVNILVQVRNKQKQIVAEQTTSVDQNGDWNIVISRPFPVGEYQLLVTAKDNNFASSFPTISDIINVTQRPALVVGSLEINQTWFFVTLILLMSAAFLVGWFGYDNWMDQLDRKVTVAQRDVKNILDNLDKDIDDLLKYFENGTLDRAHLNQMKDTLKNIKSNVEKSRPYIIENIREIEK